MASNGAKLYVDARSLRGGDGSVRLDQRFLFPEGRHRLSRVDQQVVYSCKSKTVRTLRSVEFDRSGRVAHRGGANAVPPYEVTPGTLPEYVLELVC